MSCWIGPSWPKVWSVEGARWSSMRSGRRWRRRDGRSDGKKPVRSSRTESPAVRGRFSTTDRPVLRPVLNASGVLLHTGLGRAPLAAEAVEAVDQVARGYCNLEFDLERGERGRRTSGVSELLRRLTGAEQATVVNNNAAGTVLALRALAEGREVVVARGQLVEIGGSFRLPEIFEVSGAAPRGGDDEQGPSVRLRARGRAGDRRPAPRPSQQLSHRRFYGVGRHHRNGPTGAIARVVDDR